MKNKQTPEVSGLNDYGQKILGNRLIPHIKKFMSGYMEDDFNK